ncbi:hypothetical protein [Actinoplanes sp. NPDC089786]|uniref:hypothetical protein n=1 Tax=Actinoplanes sp. NPDC089786 TaxID=3155185 RepID=UPI003434CB1E
MNVTRKIAAAVLGAAAAAAFTVAATAGPASATTPTGPSTRYKGEPVCATETACFYHGIPARYLDFFQGPTAWYTALTDDCTTLPFDAYGLFNLTGAVTVYPTTDCSGSPVLNAGAYNYYSWQTRSAARSFRPA